MAFGGAAKLFVLLAVGVEQPDERAVGVADFLRRCGSAYTEFVVVIHSDAANAVTQLSLALSFIILQVWLRAGLP